LLDPHSLPSFQQRLGLIGKVVLHYKHMYPLTLDVATVAEILRDKFLIDPNAPKLPDPLADVEWESGAGGG
jgi:hypothetical protein